MSISDLKRNAESFTEFYELEDITAELNLLYNL